MSRYNLSLQQQRIVRSVAAALRGQTFLTFFWGYKPNTIEVPEEIGAEPIDCSADDFHAICASGLFRHSGEFSTGGSTGVELSRSAFNVIRDNFGWRKRDTVLKAMRELAGDSDREVADSEIPDVAGLSVSDVQNALPLLQKERLIESYKRTQIPNLNQDTPEGADLVHIVTFEGIAAAEDPLTDESSGIAIHGSNIGSVSTGSHSVANVVQNIANADSDLLAQLMALTVELIAGLQRELPREFAALSTEIDELRSQVQSGHPDAEVATSTIRGVFRRVIDAIDWSVDRIDKTAKAVRVFQLAVPLLFKFQEWWELKQR